MTFVETLRRGGLARIALARRKPTGVASAPSAPPAAAPREGTPQLRDWIGVLAMGTGLFLAIMDVQIVTSSLTQIQGGLSASTDEIAWVQTAYLIADVIMVRCAGSCVDCCRPARCSLSPRWASPGPAYCALPRPVSAR